MANSVARQLEALYKEIGIEVVFSYVPRTEKDRALLADARDSGEEGDKTDPEFLKASVYVRTKDGTTEKASGNAPATNSIEIKMSGANAYVPFIGDTVLIRGTVYTITKIDPRVLFGEVSKYTMIGAG